MPYHEIELLTIDEACIVASGTSRPINKSTYYRWAKAGRVPMPISIGPGVSRVVASQLRAAIRSMVDAASREETPQESRRMEEHLDAPR